jgi:hypothetical protein
MNQNDMDRYFWRTGRRWSGDYNAAKQSSRRPQHHGREILLLCLAFIVTLGGLALMR